MLVHRSAMGPMPETSSSEDTSGNFGVAIKPAEHSAQRSVRRINLHDLTGRLSKILGPKKGSEYLAFFSSFLSQRLSKAELDKRLLQTLGRDNIHLHNQIVKAILCNAASRCLPPQRTTAKRKAKAESPTSPLQVSRPRPVATTGWQEEDRAKRSRIHEDGQRLDPITAPLGVRLPVRRRCKLLLGDGDDLLEATQLPDDETMHRRVQRLAGERAGMEGVQHEVAKIFNHALDVHLGRIIRPLIEQVQTGRPAAAAAPISIHDLQVAMGINPLLLGDNWPTQLERVSLRSFEQRQRQQQ